MAAGQCGEHGFGGHSPEVVEYRVEGVSKHVQRLVDAGLVLRSPIPGNRKELSLSLTDDGAVVVDAHRKLHDEMSRGMAGFLRRYTGEELALLIRVLTDLLASEKVGVLRKPPS